MKGTTKFYFMWYPSVVIILFKRVYIRQYFISALLENYCFVFLCFLSALCFKFVVTFINLIKLCMIDYIDTRCYVILFSHWFMKTKKLYYKSSIMTLKAKTCFQRGFEFFCKKTSIKKRKLKWNQNVKLVKKV